MFEHYRAARTFRRLMEQPTETQESNTIVLQHRLIAEEYEELLEAHCNTLTYPGDLEAREHALKELADLAYVCFQYAAARGWDLDEALDRVHRSNLSKLDDNLRPIRREDGKVLKGPNYKPPVLNDLV